MIRSYQDSDYDRLKALYLRAELYGGVFDEARDGRERLAIKITNDPQAILVAEVGGQLVGTISIIEDGRVAWLYRFLVVDFDPHITQELYNAATKVLIDRGHSEVLVYSEPNNIQLDHRYVLLGMTQGGTYQSYYASLGKN